MVWNHSRSCLYLSSLHPSNLRIDFHIFPHLGCPGQTKIVLWGVLHMQPGLSSLSVVYIFNLLPLLAVTLGDLQHSKGSGQRGRLKFEFDCFPGLSHWHAMRLSKGRLTPQFVSDPAILLQPGMGNNRLTQMCFFLLILCDWRRGDFPCDDVLTAVKSNAFKCKPQFYESCLLSPHQSPQSFFFRWLWSPARWAPRWSIRELRWNSYVCTARSCSWLTIDS